MQATPCSQENYSMYLFSFRKKKANVDLTMKQFQGILRNKRETENQREPPQTSSVCHPGCTFKVLRAVLSLLHKSLLLRQLG